MKLNGDNKKETVMKITIQPNNKTVLEGELTLEIDRALFDKNPTDTEVRAMVLDILRHQVGADFLENEDNKGYFNITVAG